MEHNEEYIPVEIIQSVSGNWAVYSAGVKIDGAVFRRAGDAQEWCNAEGYDIRLIQYWTPVK